MTQIQRKAVARTATDRPPRRGNRVTGLLLQCPVCSRNSRVRTADLIDGQELRCDACKSDLVVARNYDTYTGRSNWELLSLEDDYDDDQP